MGSTMARLLDGLERRTTWKNAASAVGCIALGNLATAGYILPGIEARRPEALADDFLVLIDLAPLSSAAEIYKIFDLYTPDILGFVRLFYALDFVIPLMFAICTLCLVGKMLRYLQVTGAWRFALLLPFAALPFDYAENASSLFLIDQYQHGQVFPTLARVTSVVTAIKFLGLGCAGLTLVILLLRTAARRVTRRTPRSAA